MHDDDMTPFEQSLAIRLRVHSEIQVAPSNTLAEARQAMTSRRRSGFVASWASLRAPMRTAIVVALLGALLTGVLAVGARLVWPPLTVTIPPAPTEPAPSQQSTLDAALEGVWIATMPADLTIGDSGAPGTLSLTFDAGGAHATLKVAPSDQIRLFADVDRVPDGLRIVGKQPSAAVALDGVELAGCPAGDTSTYSSDRSSDGLFLTLSVVSDTCAARTAVLARTWVRSLGEANSGGLGVVTDVLDQSFLVKIPEGSYSVERTRGSITIVQPVPELQLLAILDPQGFNDPCDIAAGRFAVEPGADAFVAYFRQLDGFTVDSTSELRVDGHRAVRLVVHANADAACPSGARLTEFQARLEQPSGPSWFLQPGDTDSLIIVELPGATVMFEVLPAPNDVEAEVIGSIRFLDELPTSP